MRNSSFVYSVIATLFIMVLCFFSCQKNHEDDITYELIEVDESDVVMKVVVCPIGTTSESYCINIKSNGLILYNMGIRIEFDVSKNIQYLRDVTKKGEVTVDNGECEELLELVESFKNDPPNEEFKIAMDIWIVQILCDDILYVKNFDTIESETVLGIIELLFDLSPIDINLHDWA